KLQVITQFEVEQPGARTAKALQKAAENSGGEAPENAPSSAKNPADVPERFVAYLFDDVHLEFGDLARVREAAERHFSTLRPTDRAAIFTTSGLGNLDYTDDHAQLHEALLRLQPRPVAGGFEHDCPDISYYQADLIINKNDRQALQVELQEAVYCQPPFPGAPPPDPAPIVNSSSMRALSSGDHE